MIFGKALEDFTWSEVPVIMRYLRYEPLWDLVLTILKARWMSEEKAQRVMRPVGKSL